MANIFVPPIKSSIQKVKTGYDREVLFPFFFWASSLTNHVKAAINILGFLNYCKMVAMTTHTKPGARYLLIGVKIIDVMSVSRNQTGGSRGRHHCFRHGRGENQWHCYVGF